MGLAGMIYNGIAKRTSSLVLTITGLLFFKILQQIKLGKSVKISYKESNLLELQIDFEYRRNLSMRVTVHCKKNNSRFYFFGTNSENPYGKLKSYFCCYIDDLHKILLC